RVVLRHPELRCVATKANGQRCGMARLRGRVKCFYHDEAPETVEARDRARGKGLAAVRAVLNENELPSFDLSTHAGSFCFRERLIALVLTGKLNPRSALAANAIAARLPQDFEELVSHYRIYPNRARDLPAEQLARLEAAWK